MSQKLVRIDRTANAAVHIDAANNRSHIFMVNPRRANLNEGDDPISTVEFFLVEDRDIPGFVEAATRSNPGVEVQVYGLEEISTRPAGDMVTKKVTKDGVLPS